jgi:hypothetical protein
VESAPVAQDARVCVSCTRSIPVDAFVCPYCGHDYRSVLAGTQPVGRSLSPRPVMGGVLIMCGALLMMVGAIFFILLLPLAVVAFLGGAFAVQRKHFTLAVIGGTLSVPSVFGLGGVILVILSRDEFG